MPLSSQLYCNACGALNQDHAEYCSFCEAPLHTPWKEPLIKGRYRLLVPVGQGGFGAVYKVEDTQDDNRLLALKDINMSALTTQEAIEATDAFNREVQLLSGLNHPNLPSIHDHFIDGEHWYLVMDFIEGETLEHYLERTTDGRLPLPEVLAIGIQLATVLDHLHTREPAIIFRDLKPANVMLSPGGHLYLLDFGIARRFKPGQLRDTIPFGSPGYAAPEQYGRAQTTPRADIYSLGALLHALLTGHDPAENPFRFEPLPLDLPCHEQLQSLIMQMVEMDVNDRPPDMTVVKQTLEQMVTASRPVGTLLTTCHHYRLVLTLAWSPDGTYTASGTANTALHIWNATTGRHIFNHRDHLKTATWTASIAWSPGGEHIAFGSDDRTVQIWQVEKDLPFTIKHSFTYRGHRNWVNTVAWSPDGSRIASGSDDQTVQIWQMGNTSRDKIYRGHSLWVVALAWSPDGRYIASGGNDKTVQIWDVESMKTVLIYREHPFGVTSLSWSPDGKYIASCSWDNVIRIWDTGTGKTLFAYQSHDDWINAVAWSPDGTRIAFGGRDKTVQIGEVATGKILFTYYGHFNWVYTVAWSPDGTRVASAGNDGTIQIWKGV